MTNEANPPKKRGCLFYGCLTLLIVTVVGGGLLYVGYRYARTAVTGLVNDYTDTAPTQIEKVELPPAELRALEERVGAFKKSLDEQKSSLELVLGAREINALIAKERELKDKIFVLIQDGLVKGKVSIPLEDLGPLKLKGRYLNGTATFKLALENGQLQVNLDQMEVNGKALPAPILAEFKKQNFAQNVQNDPKTAEAIRKFESIRIEDDRVILKSRSQE